MPQRLRAYAALAEERYGLNIFPVVINILPLGPTETILTSYHSDFMGLMAHQDYRVINLWEVDVDMVQAQDWTTLLPFAPILKGGDNPLVIRKALARLREDEQLADMEALLAFFATFVMTPEEVLRLMRWDMTMLRESPWYSEIEEEAIARGLEQGLQQGLVQGRRRERYEMLIRLLDYRFGATPLVFQERVQQLGIEQLGSLIDAALTAPSLEAVEETLSTLPYEAVGMDRSNGTAT